MSATFLLTTLIVVVSPGVGVLYTLAAGLARGPRAAVVAAVGCTLGIVPHLMAAAILGLAALLHASPIAFQVLKFWVSPISCGWRGVRCRSTVRCGSSRIVAAKPALRVIVEAVLLNLLNPSCRSSSWRSCRSSSTRHGAAAADCGCSNSVPCSWR